jgi:hypothetical protein
LHEHTTPEHVVEVVAHELSYLAGAGEEEALATGRFMRLSFEQASHKLRRLDAVSRRAPASDARGRANASASQRGDRVSTGALLPKCLARIVLAGGHSS